MEGKAQMESIRTNTISDLCKIIEVNEGGKKHTIKLNIMDAAGD